MMPEAVELDLAAPGRQGSAARLYRQNIAGCLDTRIGIHGLDAGTLSGWLDKLAGPLADRVGGL